MCGGWNEERERGSIKLNLGANPNMPEGGPALPAPF